MKTSPDTHNDDRILTAKQVIHRARKIKELIAQNDGTWTKEELKQLDVLLDRMFSIVPDDFELKPPSNPKQPRR